MEPEEAYAAVADVASYATRMRGVRSAKTKTTESLTRAAFKVTKFRLPANLVFAPDPARLRVAFALDAERTNVAVERLAGCWHVSPRPGGGSRVSLRASVEACKIVPAAAVAYVAEKALARATALLDP